MIKLTSTIFFFTIFFSYNVNSVEAEIGKWKFSKEENYCLIISLPLKEEGNYDTSNRGDTYVMVYRINKSPNSVVQINAGYNYNNKKKVDKTAKKLFVKEGYSVETYEGSYNENELITGSKAGADYILSLKSTNIHLLDEIDSIPILIPDKPDDMNSLFKIIDTCIDKKRTFVADPICFFLDPVPIVIIGST